MFDRPVGTSRTRGKTSIRWLISVAFVVISVLGFASCDWNEFRFGPDHTGDNPVESAISVSNVSSLVLRFTAATVGSIGLSSPAVVNGVAYIGDEVGKMYAFDAAGNTNCSGTPKTCAPLWTATTGNSIQSSPTVVDGVAYVGSEGGGLYAFDAAGNTNCSGTPKTCVPLWTGTTRGGIGSSPAVVNGVVYIGSDDGNLYAFDAVGNTNCSGTPKTCAPLWTGPTAGGGDSSPAVSNGVVYVGSIGGNLYAFGAAGNTNCSGTPKTCAPLWIDHTGSGSFPGDAVVSSPAVFNGVVYIGDFSGNVSAFDAAGNTNCSGTPKVCLPLWAAGVGTNGGITSSPAVANGTVYIGDECNLQGNPPQPVCNNPPHFYAINATTGARSWTAIGSAAAVTSSPAVANGVVFVGSGDGNLYAFDAAGSIDCSGTPTFCSPLWTAGTGRGFGSSPTIANGKVYVGSGDGKLYVFGLP